MASVTEGTSTVDGAQEGLGGKVKADNEAQPADGEADTGDFNEEEEERGEEFDDDDGVVWEELFACPLTVRFTQEKVHPFFYRRGPIVNVLPKIRITPHLRSRESEPLGVSPAEVARDMVLELVAPFEPIHCLRKGKHLWSLDNRRLYALQLAAMEYWPQQCCVRLMSSDRLPRKKFKTQYRKFKTQSEGMIVYISSRYQQFDIWSWAEKAVEIESYTISTQLGVMLSTFETLPVIGALLFRTGLTGLESRTPLCVAFLMTFAIDFTRQKVPAFEKKIAQHHVKAVIDGDIKYWPACCRRKKQARFTSQGYEDVTLSVSAPQLASIMALLMVLTLPYVIAIPHDKVRSSVFSCWLGITCVLAVQLTGIVRAGISPEVLTNSREDDDDGPLDGHRLPKAPRDDGEDAASRRISPKHRD